LLEQDLFCDIRVTRCEAHLVSGLSFRRRNQNSRSVAVAVQASGLERTGLYPTADHDDGIRIR
jgi:hypothetical protein